MPPVVPGERVLAWAEAAEGVVAGTRDALYLRVSSVDTRIAWELVEAADWDRDTSVLRVSEVGTWGVRRPEHRLTLEEPGRLLELVRERVTASVVLQRHVPLRGRRGLRVIARRAPRGDQPLTWLFEYDAGIDPADPEVQRAAREALAAAQEEVGTA
ncbi:hypothetical protein GCM10009844_43560 [Nocardioides koreensis]|uniref:SRPBCC family protein n=1 Tax=Nocardioides koreensis TaxID=433651 RepID=A0ABN3A844_9ACTN